MHVYLFRVRYHPSYTISTGHRFDNDTPIEETVCILDIKRCNAQQSQDASFARRRQSGIRTLHWNVIVLGLAMWAIRFRYALSLTRRF